MKRTASIALLGGALLVAGAYVADLSFQRTRTLSCPTLERLKTADAALDAQRAHARRDDHLIMLGGFVGTVPGARETLINRLPKVMLDGASDTTTEGCRRLRPIAEAYASIYNAAISRLAGRS